MSTTNHRFLNLKLYQTITCLVVAVILVSLTACYLLMNAQMTSIISENIGVEATRITYSLKNSNVLREALEKEPPDKTKITSIVTHVSDATGASIIVFDEHESIIAINNPTNRPILKDDLQYDSKGKLLDELKTSTFKSEKIDPIRDDSSTIIGYVVVAFPNDTVGNINSDMLDIIVVSLVIGLIIGILLALALSKNIKTTLFGYEPPVIANMLQERNILLDNIREGIIAVDRDLTIYVINQTAQLLLQKAGIRMPAKILGSKLTNFMKIDSIQDVLTTGIPAKSIELDLQGMKTISYIIPIFNNDEVSGLLLSLRQKDEVIELAEQLSGVANYADALRARSHEFMNKMHVMSGLLMLNKIDELKEYMSELVAFHDTKYTYFTEKIREPLLSGFILGKKNRAEELNIEFYLTEESFFPDKVSTNLNIHDIILIIGNLLENAFEALRHYDGEKIVNLTILTYEDEYIIIVEDSGPGIPTELQTEIFKKNVTTKGKGHGLGLSMVQTKVDEVSGSITLESTPGEGATFTVTLPIERGEEHD